PFSFSVFFPCIPWFLLIPLAYFGGEQAFVLPLAVLAEAQLDREARGVHPVRETARYQNPVAVPLGLPLQVPRLRVEHQRPVQTAHQLRPLLVVRFLRQGHRRL